MILVGGQSRFPLVHEKITAFFGKAPSKGVHPDEAVALGAALLAHSLGQLEGVVLIDVLPMAIGVGLPGGRFKPVIERNTSLPGDEEATRSSTSRENQTELELTIFQGDSDRAQENEYLGTLKLAGLPEGPARLGADRRHLRGEQRVPAQGHREGGDHRARGLDHLLDEGHARGGEGEDRPGSARRVPACPPPRSPRRRAGRAGCLGWFKKLFGRA